MIVEDDDKDWDLEGIMTADNVGASEVCGKICALHEKFCSGIVEVLATMLAVVALVA